MRQSEEVSFLFLAPYRGHFEIWAYPTSRVIRANCGHLCWLSPQGEPRAQTSYTICIDCGQDVLHDPDPQGKRIAVAGSLEWLREQHGVQAEQVARSFMRRHGILPEGE